MNRIREMMHLDKMAEFAAKQFGVEAQYGCFGAVIKFNYETDVSHFPDLWSGRPPMAHFSSSYVEVVQKLKRVILRRSSETYEFDNLVIHLTRLWKAIMQDFVFSFKNTFEMAAYKNLEVQFSEWSWSCKRDMIDWEISAKNNMLMGSKPDRVEYIYIESIRSLPVVSNDLHRKYASKLELYFRQKANQPTHNRKVKTFSSKFTMSCCRSLQETIS